MGEDLKRVNSKFKELIDNYRRKKTMTRNDERLAYMFFLMGYSEGCGMEQQVVA